MPHPALRTPRLLPVALLLAPLSAAAADFLVDTTSDDGSAAFQVCDANPANADCSLRGALTRANAISDADEIHFAIPEADPGFVAATAHWRIVPATDLPMVSHPVTIDGYTQPGATPNTLAPDEGGNDAVLKIELSGAGRNGSLGLTGYNLGVRGLAINDFNQNLYLGLGAQVEGCFIGTDIRGMTAVVTNNSNRIGVHLVSGTSGQKIGGSTPAARNVISGHTYMGVWDESGATAQPNVYAGNLIGLAADGSSVIPGQDYGIYMNTAPQGSVIGGDTVAARNVFAGNEFGAVVVTTGSTSSPSTPLTRIQGNLFGTDYTGALVRPNGSNPASPSQAQPTLIISRLGGCGVQVGGDAPGEGNLIANGATSGLHVGTCTGAAILGNVFRGNRQLGIDLSPFSLPDGATANDPGDADEGGNRLQNHPVITSFACSSGTCTLGFRVDSDVANASYPLRIDLMRGRNGQPEAPIASMSYTAGDAGLERTISFAAAALEGGGLVLSATDALGNTSEFGGDHLFWADFD